MTDKKTKLAEIIDKGPEIPVSPHVPSESKDEISEMVNSALIKVLTEKPSFYDKVNSYIYDFQNRTPRLLSTYNSLKTSYQQNIEQLENNILSDYPNLRSISATDDNTALDFVIAFLTLVDNPTPEEITHFSSKSGLSEAELNTLRNDNLDLIDEIKDLSSQIYNAKKQLSDRINQDHQNELETEKFFDNFNIYRQTGVYIDLTSLPTNLNYNYVNGGITHTGEFNIEGVLVQKDKTILYEIELTDPVTHSIKKFEFTVGQLINLLHATKAHNIVNSPDEVLKSTYLKEVPNLNLSKDQTFQYLLGGEPKDFKIIEVTADTITIEPSIIFNGKEEDVFAFHDFSKLLNQYQACPQINQSEFIAVLNEMFNYPPEQPIELSKVLFTSIDFTYNSLSSSQVSQIAIKSIDDKKVTYTLAGEDYTVPLSVLLSRLVIGRFIPLEKSENTPQTLQSETQTKSPTNTPNKTSENPEEQKIESNDAKKSFSLLGTLSSIMTFGGNITYLNYYTYKTVIGRIVDDIKTNLSIREDARLGSTFSGLQGRVGEHFASLKSSASRKRLEYYQEKAKRIGDWPSLVKSMYKADDVLEFIAICLVLKEKGYLPFMEDRFAKKMKNLGIGDNISLNPNDKSERKQEISDAFDKAADEKGFGASLISGNESAASSAVNNFKYQLADTYNSIPDKASTKLHNLIFKHSNEEVVDPHLVKAHILAAITSGNVNTHEILFYCIAANKLTQKDGTPILNEFNFLEAEIKNWPFINMLFDPSSFNFLAENIFTSDFKAAFQSKGEISGKKISFKDRLPDSERVISILLSGSLNRMLGKKQSEILDAMNKDSVPYSVTSADFEVIYSALFPSRSTPYPLFNDKTLPKSIDKYHEKLLAYTYTYNQFGDTYKKDKNYGQNYYKEILNSIKNYLLIEASIFGKIVEEKDKQKYLPTVNQQTKNSLQSTVDATTPLLQKLLQYSDSPQKDSLLAGVSNITPENYKKLIEEVIGSIKEEDFAKFCKDIS